MKKNKYVCVVPTVGRPELVERCIPSLLAQSMGFLEIIIVSDDLNYDGKDALSLSKKIKVLHTRGQQGGPAARALGYRNSTADYCVFVDDDDAISVDFLSNLDSAISLQMVDVGIVIPKVIKIWEEGLVPSHQARPPMNTIEPTIIPQDVLEKWCPSTSSGLVFSKKCFSELTICEEIKGFNDVQMVRAGARLGVTVLFCPSAVANFYQYFSRNRMTSSIGDRLHNLEVAKNRGLLFSVEEEKAIVAGAVFSSMRSTAYVRGLIKAFEIFFSCLKDERYKHSLLANKKR